MSKKVNAQQFQERIRQIVKEEVMSAVLKEQMSPYLDSIRDKKQLSAWLMRQYFNPAKHTKKIWFDPSVTEENVLNHISSTERKGVFPLSAKELAELWKLKKSLGQSLGKLSDAELSQGEVKPVKKVEDEKTKYQTGDVTLRDVGQELGGLTPTMINKLSDTGMEKFKKLLGGKGSDDFAGQTKNLMQKISQAREEVAKDFAIALKSAPSVESFLADLVKAQTLTVKELELIEPEEKEGLDILREREPDAIAAILAQDIEDVDNLFKTFQSAVSKKMLPYGKRGRPRKEDSVAQDDTEE
jgi:hypothetical protein